MCKDRSLIYYFHLPTAARIALALKKIIIILKQGRNRKLHYMPPPLSALHYHSKHKIVNAFAADTT